MTRSGSQSRGASALGRGGRDFGRLAVDARQAAYLTVALAEFLRLRHKKVLRLMHSVTRFTMSFLETGLSVGEPQTSKSYMPSDFSEVPQLLVRAGPGVDRGSITGLLRVLMTGDDHNGPVADVVRSILENQIVLDCAIAERNRHPVVDVLRSVYRTLRNCNSDDENALVARILFSTYEDIAGLIRIGAHKNHSDEVPEIDETILHQPRRKAFLSQPRVKYSDLASGYAELAAIIGQPAAAANFDAAN